MNIFLSISDDLSVMIMVNSIQKFDSINRLLNMRRSDLVSLKKKCNEKLSVCNIAVGTITEFGVILYSI